MEIPLIQLNGISKSFDGIPVLNGVDAAVSKGKSSVILGKNGSGKSVLLKIAAGLIPPDAGDVIFNGKRITRNDYYSGDGVSIGYVFQKGGLFDSMDLFDNTAFPLRRKGLAEDEIEHRVFNNLKRVGLEGSERRFPSELSGGMQKRAGIARVLSVNPSVILYDDPTAGLDPVLTDSIADLILEIKESELTASLIVTHDMKFAEKVADTVLLLVSSRHVFSGSKEEFFSMKNSYAAQFISGETEGPIEFL